MAWLGDPVPHKEKRVQLVPKWMLHWLLDYWHYGVNANGWGRDALTDYATTAGICWSIFADATLVVENHFITITLIKSTALMNLRLQYPQNDRSQSCCHCQQVWQCQPTCPTYWPTYLCGTFLTTISWQCQSLNWHSECKPRWWGGQGQHQVAEGQATPSEGKM